MKGAAQGLKPAEKGFLSGWPCLCQRGGGPGGRPGPPCPPPTPRPGRRGPGRPLSAGRQGWDVPPPLTPATQQGPSAERRFSQGRTQPSGLGCPRDTNDGHHRSGAFLCFPVESSRQPTAVAASFPAPPSPDTGGETEAQGVRVTCPRPHRLQTLEPRPKGRAGWLGGRGGPRCPAPACAVPPPPARHARARSPRCPEAAALLRFVFASPVPRTCLAHTSYSRCFHSC